MGLANFITGLRIILLPFVIYFIYQESWSYALAALILFSFIILAGLLDLNHTKNNSYTTSSFLDPFSDKIVVLCLLIVFLSLDEFWLLPLLIFVIRDFVVNGIRTIGSRMDVALEKDKVGKIQNFFLFGIGFLILLKKYLIYDGYEGTELITGITSLILTFTLVAVFLAILSAIIYGYKCHIAIKNKKESGEKLEEEDFIILANKKSRGYHDGIRRKLLRMFARKRNSEVVYISPEEKMFENKEIIKEIKKHKHIVVAGGDGSFESALNHKILKKKVLGFFPLGAGNAYYSYFYRGKKFVYLRSKFKFKVSDLDVIKLEWDGGSKETTFLSIGIDAEVIRLSKKRTHLGFLDYVYGSWKTLLESKANYALALDIDGKKICWDQCANLTLTTIPFLGFDLRSVISKCNNDGKINCQAVINKDSLLFNKLLRLWALILSQMRMEHPPIYEFSGKKIEIFSEVPFPIQAGGEFVGYSQHLKVQVVRKQKVLVI